jgi:hypothetical protein
MVLLLNIDYHFCGYVVLVSEFFFAIDFIFTKLSTHVVEY